MNADELTRLLDDLTSRLEGPARYAFDLLVRQMAIEGVGFAVIGVALLVIGAVVWRRGSGWSAEIWRDERAKYEKSSGYGYPDRFESVLVRLGSGALSGFLWLVAMLFGWAALTRLLNPEYAALERLLTLLP